MPPSYRQGAARWLGSVAVSLVKLKADDEWRKLEIP
jgi:hypothetical protein